MDSRVSGLKAIVFNNRTAPFGVTHGSNISYAQCVTTLMSTDVLKGSLG